MPESSSTVTTGKDKVLQEGGQVGQSQAAAGDVDKGVVPGKETAVVSGSHEVDERADKIGDAAKATPQPHNPGPAPMTAAIVAATAQSAIGEGDDPQSVG